MDRRRFIGLATITLATVTTPILTRSPRAYAADAPGALAAEAATTWKNVQIYGGGFIPGIIFSQTRQNLLYARTDIGGAYRWDTATGSWIPLLDWVGNDHWGWNGVVSMAIDESAPDKVYAAAGMYTNSWDPGNGAVLRSADLGATWQATQLPFKLGGNMPGRGMGERLAVDPNDGRVLYLGTPSGNGLWRSTDAGVTWAKVTAFPNPGTYRADPSDTSGYNNDLQGVVWVTFDKTTGSAGVKSRHIYVGVADKDNTVYRSTDGGTTWAALVGAPTGYIAHKGVLDHVNGRLYLATSDTGGPYDGGKGDVWKYDIAATTWTRISPVPSTSADAYYGYSGLSVDRKNPNTLMVVTQMSWWPDIIVFRSTDAGATWTRIWDFGGSSRTFRYTQDISEVPWLTFGSNPAPPEVTPKLGWMTESLEIDPFDSNRVLYGTGATIYASTNLTNWDKGTQFTIKPMVKGLEETSVLDLVSPPSGSASLLSALGDIGGFRHTDLTKVPALMFTSPNLSSTTSIDFAELTPSVMARVGNVDKSNNPQVNRAGFSSDGGATWWQASSEPAGVTGGGTVAVAADGSAVLWSPQGAAVQRTTTTGSSWSAVGSLPQGALVRADRAKATVFYAWSAGAFYASTDGGATFARTSASGLPSDKAGFKPVPGKQGEIWLTGTGGLWHSTDGGASFTKLAGVTSGVNLGYGKAAPGRTNVAVYLAGTVGGVSGVFASDDAAATWRRVNDDLHQWGNMGEAVTGDPRVYGRVYVGTNGRGIVYADSPGSTSPGGDTTAPSTPAGLAATAHTATTVALAWTAATDDVGATGYDVLRDGTAVGSTASTAYTDTALTPSTAYAYRVRAKDAAGNVSALSAAVTVTTDAGGGGSTGTVKAQYKNNDSSASDNAIRPGLQLVNTGTGALTLAQTVIRYYFTGEAGAATYSTWCDWAQLGSGNITHKVVALASPVSGADHYLEVGFASGAGSLAAGASTGEIQMRLNKTDWSNFGEADDYSRGTNTSFADAPKITVHVNGTVAWGTAP
ncbi:cellulose binding domain-containing protein [Streptomyces sp. NBC_01465]|uniref:cellulose binding domain-containing protein n=1 Tax=Streptomyces sp. NBC_01465 TaxID=2903878 RepID=UPI002E31F3E8|nr:cellulose binding domain-containing protein [Streptomyces sp. NBC_01465]